MAEGEVTRPTDTNIDIKKKSLAELLGNKFSIDYYQREYVWETKQLEDLLNDLASAFMKNWRPEHELKEDYSFVTSYEPYFMGEIIISKRQSSLAIIDGQQRITTLTLLLIYLKNTYSHLPKFPEINSLIFSDYFGTEKFNIDVDERNPCMTEIMAKGDYEIKDTDPRSVVNIARRYSDISDCWPEAITEKNIIPFTYWLKNCVLFSYVETNKDDFAYVIFETMNDRGFSLTPVEMLRSYLLSNIRLDAREDKMREIDATISSLQKLKSKVRNTPENDFFKVYLRSQYAEGNAQSKDGSSDFDKIGKGFHRWIRDKSEELGLHNSGDFELFISKIVYYANVYLKIDNICTSRNWEEYLYTVVNYDYGFTLHVEPILASIVYGDPTNIVEEKIRVISKYITKIVSWYVWNQKSTNQAHFEDKIYKFSLRLRNKSLSELKQIINEDPVEVDDLGAGFVVNQNNKNKVKVLISLITAIVAKESGEPDYLYGKKDMELEHIWADHFEQHLDDFSQKSEFAEARCRPGDLLILPKSFNSSINDDRYESKVVKYFGQNILAQSLNKEKYTNYPQFTAFVKRSGLSFKSYDHFRYADVKERTDLYRDILYWNWNSKPDEKNNLDAFVMINSDANTE